MTARVLRNLPGLAIVEPPGEIPAGFFLAVRPPDRLVFVRMATGAQSVERDLAIRALVRAPSASPAVFHDVNDHRWAAVDAHLGVSLPRLLEEERAHGGQLDPLVWRGLVHHAATLAREVEERAGHRIFIAASDVWLGYDGTIQILTDLDVEVQGNGGFLDPLFITALPEIDGRPARDLMLQARAAREDAEAALGMLPGLLAAVFPEERRMSLAWLEELAIDELTDPRIATVLGPDGYELVQRAHVVDDGKGPRLLVTDLVPCSVARIVGESNGHRGLLSFRESAAPATGLSHATASVVCRALAAWDRSRTPWRLPTEPEWDRLSSGGGRGRRSSTGVADLCRVWEWTDTPRHGGHIVRGGPWRDRDVLAIVDNRSSESDPGPDVGFRAVRLHDYPVPVDDDWEPRT